MAGRGPAPNDPDKRRGHDRPPVVEEIGGVKVKAPGLPGATGFTAATRRWYRVWGSSPQASQFTQTDWQRLHMLAPLVDRYFMAPSTGLMAEIRLNEAKLGGTPEDRQRLRWRLPTAEASGEQSTRKPSRQRSDPRLKVVA
jgi:hypothetical protein